MFCKKSVPRNFAKFPGKDLCQSLFFNKVFEKETLAQVFYCEFCEISKNTFFTEHLRWLLLWFMLVPSIVATWVSWFNGYRFKLEAEGFIFHILQRNFQNLGVKILALCSAKIFGVFIFPYFVLSYLFKVWSFSKFGYNVPKTDTFFSFSVHKWYKIVQTNRHNKTSIQIFRIFPTNKAPLA